MLIASRRKPAGVCSAPTTAQAPARPGALSGLSSAGRAMRRAATAQAYELALMATVVAMLPLHLLRAESEAPSTRSSSMPAPTREAVVARPVLLVHGLGGRKSSWSLVNRTLSARGLTVEVLAYASFGTSIEQVADRLVAEVERLLSETRSDEVHLVGHSLGGVVIAQAIASGRLDGRVNTVITLGSPFGGSPWAKLLPFGAIIPALQHGSPLLSRIATAPTPDGVRWLAFTAALDMVVPRLRAVPAHADAETITVRRVGHLGMLSSQQVVGRIADALPA